MLEPHIPVVFVVDDEVVIAKSLAQILGKNGFRALPFTNPLEALGTMETTNPDLLDQRRDDAATFRNGPGNAGEGSPPEMQDTALSGQANMADLLHAARKRGHNFHLLEKPIHPTKLLQEIEKL